ncbi:MAG: ADP-ribosylglycohydrolase family protein [Firmicutes bacterium]|nr:ADP-ribosylglycohydrolase family protein [Bacillota bacterium]MDD4336220.1 ADP-ribosylglycohydrolase family protein [Bacillota bacterium]
MLGGRIDPNRITGALAGVAIGDAMGMPSEFMTREQIRDAYGRIEGFCAPREGHIHCGMGAGRITDDTEQTLALIEALDRHGRITPEVAAEAYLKWAEQCNAYESSVLGPSSRKALEKLKAGEDPRTTGSSGSTVGAAMRVAPIGIVNSPDLERAAEECYMSCLPTHGVNIAIAGACAICCGVAVALTAESLEEVIDGAIRGARYGERLGIQWAGTLVSARIQLALRIVAESSSVAEAEDLLYTTCGVGMDPTELVSTAVGLCLLHGGDPQSTVAAAANMGGDTDTLASMVGALLGAYRGVEAFPQEWIDTVQEVNNLDFEEITAILVAVRERRYVHNGWHRY